MATAASERCRILTVSEFSRARLLHWFPDVVPARVHVVPNGVDLDVFKPKGSPLIARDKKRFFLSVGSLQPRKNLALLTRLWSREDLQLPELRIVGAPGPQFSRQPLNPSNDKIRWLGRLSDEALIEQYRQAQFVILPSLYEGSALTALEAMACECPVLASGIPAHREVIGAAGAFFGPNRRGIC